MKTTKIKSLLEEAIKSWELEIKELKHMTDWIREEADTSVNLRECMKHKKELIEEARSVLKE